MSSKYRVARTAGLCSAALSLLCLTNSASAQEDTSGFYFGAFGGQAAYDIAKEDLDDLFVFAFDFGGATILDGESSLEDSDTGFGAIAGYRFNPYFALEASYVDLGAAEYRIEGIADLGFDIVDFQGGTDIQASGPMVSLLGIIPISESFEIYGKAGMFFAEVDFDIFIEDETDTVSESSEEVMYGLGFAWNVNPSWSLRLDFQRFSDVGEEDTVGEANIDQFSLGVLYRL